MLRRIICRMLAVLLCASFALPQQTAQNQQQRTPTVTATTPRSAMQGFGLEDGTPIKLRTARASSSADARIGDTLDIKVLFLGSTPSSISLPVGDHEIAIEKSELTAWNRTISVSGGHNNINAELTAESTPTFQRCSTIVEVSWT